MSQASVVALAQSFGLTADVGQLTTHYAQTMLMGAQTMSYMATVRLVEHGIDESEFTFPEDLMHVTTALYDERLLSMETQDALVSMNPAWRQVHGRPIAIVQLTETDGTYRLYPRPDGNSGPLTLAHADPLGVDLPEGMIVLFGSEAARDWPETLELWCVFATLSRVFLDETIYRDPAMATWCGAMQDCVEACL